MSLKWLLTTVIFSGYLKMLFERIAGNGCFHSDWKCSLAIILRGFLESFLRESLTYLFQSFWECCFQWLFEKMLENVAYVVSLKCCLKRCFWWFFSEVIWNVVANNHSKWFSKYCFSHVFQAKSFKVSLIVS